ncbi:MAG: cation:proton antiporter [Ignavibacterium sp.]|nr:cation:proton antiporter [Ignavibacterium sp.]MDW8375075.1 cation:proton antiporter [Ignavibacteriales bacterium]
MNHLIIIQDIVIILFFSLTTIFLFNKMKIPTIVGFLISGMIIGPYGLKLIKSGEEIEVMAEFGVILLLFTIGIEVSLSQIIKIKKFLVYGGGLQFFLTSILSFIIFIQLGIELNQSVFFSFLISLSSTAIIMKLLSDKNEVDTPHGKISMAISLFQDLMIVPLFLLLPIIANKTQSNITFLILKIIGAFATTALLIIASKYFMKPLVHQIAKLRLREAFTIGIILMILGTAYITHQAGLSFAIGAFIAGLILSETDFNHQIISEIIPLKDAFNSLFFVSIGLLLNIQFVFQNSFLVIGLTLLIFLFKVFIIVLSVFLLKYPFRTALLTGIGLGQVGEFSFILALAGTKMGLISSEYYNIFLSSSIFTMIITPILYQLEPFIAEKLGNVESKKSSLKINLDNNLKDHVIIGGFGVNGKSLVRVLKETGIKYIVIELNPDTVKKEKMKGEKIVYGDISREDILKSVGIQNAKVIVFAISDPVVTRVGIKNVKKLNPNIYTLVRTKYLNEVDELIKLGADEVIPEEFETALQIFRKVLQKYHIPLNVIMQQVTLLRQESYRLMRKDEMDVSVLSHLDEFLAQGLTETFYISENNPNINKSLSEINLRARTNATIIAIIREGKMIPNPSPNEKIKLGDTLIIIGTHQSVDQAIEILSGGILE